MRSGLTIPRAGLSPDNLPQKARLQPPFPYTFIEFPLSKVGIKSSPPRKSDLASYKAPLTS